jgi:hypothetical protein
VMIYVESDFPRSFFEKFLARIYVHPLKVPK